MISIVNSQPCAVKNFWGMEPQLEANLEPGKTGGSEDFRQKPGFLDQKQPFSKKKLENA